MRPAAGGRGRPLLSLLILLYGTIQLGLAVRALVTDKLETRGDFSWNMYSHEYRCSVSYAVHGPGDRVRPIDFDGLFRDEASSTKILHRDRLDALHAWLCRNLAADEELQGLVSCRLDGGSFVDLVEPATDLCPRGRRPAS